MGRISRTKDCFEDFGTDKRKCKFCGKLFANLQLGNQARHLRLIHKDIAAKVGLVKKSENVKKEDLPTISIRMDKITYLKSCVELVIKNDCPFTLFDCEGFRTIGGAIEEGLQIQKIDSKKLEDIVKLMAKSVRDNLKNELKDIVFCLNIKLATHRSGRSILEINAQFIKDSQMLVRNIGMLEIDDESTGDILKGRLLKILANYECNPKNIYCVTTESSEMV